MKQIVIALIFLSFVTGCVKLDRDISSPGTAPRLYEGTAIVTEVDVDCQVFPAHLTFTSLTVYGPLPVEEAWSFSLNGYQKRIGTRLKFFYKMANASEVQNCGSSQHGYQIVMSSVEILPQ